MHSAKDKYNFFKNTSAYRDFATAFNKGLAAHAYIVASPDTYSAGYISRLIVCRILCKKPLAPCLRCNDCLRVIKGNHPDCAVYPQQGDKLYVSDVDSLVERSNYTPLEGSSKAFILLNGETLSVQAQNKLLKTLEQPPQGTYIILCSGAADSILPTIRSRSFTLEIKPFSAEATAAFLMLCGADSHRSQLIALTGDGDLGRAEAMLNDGNYASLMETIYNLADICRDMSGISSAAEALAKPVDKIQTAKILQIYFRDMLMVKTGLDSVVINKAAAGSLNAAAQRFSKVALMQLIDRLNHIKEAALVNVNFQTLIENLLFNVWEEQSKQIGSKKQ